ncbi:unnamed protein product [Ranitomeya imitator]|uniref:Uncharacterized protein n=1 Tax=Ranitomeya imitator TaxID=111125 RepID=A0ABN9MIP1_9NEOB|nr:unnamed protein product [Ranitomeya imitator]
MCHGDEGSQYLGYIMTLASGIKMTRDEGYRTGQAGEEIMIKSADKGGALVVMDHNKYVGEVLKQLGDPELYERLPFDPKFEIARKIKPIVGEALEKQIIDKDLSEFLIIEHPTTPVMYILPKIHKFLEDPTGRPIVSGCNSILPNIGVYLDRILNPIAECTDSFVRDTIDFLQKNDQVRISGEIIVASFDVTSLYTSIDHSKGLYAVGKKLISTNLSEET